MSYLSGTSDPDFIFIGQTSPEFHIHQVIRPGFHTYWVDSIWISYLKYDFEIPIFTDSQISVFPDFQISGFPYFRLAVATGRRQWQRTNSQIPNWPLSERRQRIKYSARSPYCNNLVQGVGKYWKICLFYCSIDHFLHNRTYRLTFFLLV